MAITYFNVFPTHTMLSIHNINEKFVSDLMAQTNVETDQSFNPQSADALLMLYQANELLGLFNFIGINAHVSIRYVLSCTNKGWILVVNTPGSTIPVNHVVAKFFHWDSIASQRSTPTNKRH